ncbi:MAG: urease accessory protein UreE [Succinivibrio sp.]
MKTFNTIVKEGTPSFTVTLGIDQRILSRLIVMTDTHEQIGISLPRGLVLTENTLIANEDGQIVKVLCALESVSTVRADDPISLCTLAYHLGNRHVPLEIDRSGFLRYQTDHVLDDMVVKLGAKLCHEMAKFNPLQGAYAHSHSHEHAHDHEHSHEHTHSHEHSHEHTHSHEHSHEHTHSHEHLHEHTRSHEHSH